MSEKLRRQKSPPKIIHCYFGLVVYVGIQRGLEGRKRVKAGICQFRLTKMFGNVLEEIKILKFVMTVYIFGCSKMVHIR